MHMLHRCIHLACLFLAHQTANCAITVKGGLYFCYTNLRILDTFTSLGSHSCRPTYWELHKQKLTFISSFTFIISPSVYDLLYYLCFFSGRIKQSGLICITINTLLMPPPILFNAGFIFAFDMVINMSWYILKFIFTATNIIAIRFDLHYVSEWWRIYHGYFITMDWFYNRKFIPS